jgi:5-formyltetrahydrofolate cyclo-ligase
MPQYPTKDEPTGDERTGHPGGHEVLKARLRSEIRAERMALPVLEARTSARRAIHRLWSLPILARARNLALYLPVGGELDCTPLAVQAWQRGRAVFLPVITGATLRFAPFNPESELQPNCFGIPEPATSVRHWRTARQLDVIVAPLVAFDFQGHRLGMGGGYYDRTLAFLMRRPCSRRPHFVALAFEMQRTSTVPSDPWDVCLDAVVTEARTYRFA